MSIVLLRRNAIHADGGGTRPYAWTSCAPPLATRLRLLDGAGGREANRLHYEGGHLEYRLSSRGDAHWRAPVPAAISNAGNLQGM